MLHLGDGAQLFPGQHAQPALFVLMDLDVMEARLLQRSLQLHIAVDRHARDPLGPFLVLFQALKPTKNRRVTEAFIRLC